MFRFQNAGARSHVDYTRATVCILCLSILLEELRRHDLVPGSEATGADLAPSPTKEHPIALHNPSYPHLATLLASAYR